MQGKRDEKNRGKEHVYTCNIDVHVRGKQRAIYIYIGEENTPKGELTQSPLSELFQIT